MALIPEEIYNQAKVASIKKRIEKDSALKAPSNPLDWVSALFPSIFTRPFGTMHTELFNYVWNIELGSFYKPFVAVWPRSMGKSTCVETSVLMLGARSRRKYCLYVSETQELADQHLASIRDMAESAIIRTYYPSFSKPKLTKEGHSRGWRRNRLVFGNGFTIDASGLDTARRGSKMMEQRPDLLCLDDCDAKGDSPAVTQKKIDAIFSSLLPSGSRDLFVLAVQNMIIDTGIFAKLSQETPPFMKDRVLSGPFPALNDFKWWYTEEGKIDISGTPTWDGFTIDEIRNTINTIGISAFESEYQHKIIDDSSLFSGIKFNLIPRSEVPKLFTVIIALDPAVSSDDGSDSHGISVVGASENGKYYILDSFEKRVTPEFAVKKALYFAIKYKSDRVVIEGNQGGDLWLDIWDKVVDESGLDAEMQPGIELAKVTSATGGKMERASQLLMDFELNKIFIVEDDFTETLTSALYRFPTRKPYDLVDATWHAWSRCAESARWFS
jgi:phage terminase large subunit-like protein